MGHRQAETAGSSGSAGIRSKWTIVVPPSASSIATHCGSLTSLIPTAMRVGLATTWVKLAAIAADRDDELAALRALGLEVDTDERLQLGHVLVAELAARHLEPHSATVGEATDRLDERRPAVVRNLDDARHRASSAPRSPPTAALIAANSESKS